MRWFLSKRIVCLVFIGCILAGCFPSSASPGSDEQQHLSATSNPASSVIASENALRGTTSWRIPEGHGATTQIQAYASATSVQPGQAIDFKVSTQVEGTHYSIGIYRLGWYGGLGGRLQLLLANQVGHAQGYYDRRANKIVHCSTCRFYKTGLIEANWQPSYRLTVPTDWVSGVYLAKFADANGMQTYVPFDVRGNEHSTYVVVTSDTTYQAYNYWGGFSLYGAGSGSSDEGNNALRAVKVSFDRPYSEVYGSGHVLLFELDGIHWLERQGYDLSYMSSVDLHEHPQALLQHRVYLTLGHDEYWTKEMRDGVEQARDHGVSLGFFGANAIYWQMRFEPDSPGVSDRTIVCYKVETKHHDLAHDPFYGKDNSRVTSQWRDPVLNRPENAVIGIMYSGFTLQRPGFPWQVSQQAKSPLLDGTGLQPGEQYGCDLVGYEWDHVFENGATPTGLQVLSRSRTVDNADNSDFSNTAYYIAPSGAVVFAVGSIYWTSALDSYRPIADPSCDKQKSVVPGMQKLMLHVMDVLATHHITSS